MIECIADDSEEVLLFAKLFGLFINNKPASLDIFFTTSESLETKISTNKCLIFFRLLKVQEIRGFDPNFRIFLFFKLLRVKVISFSSSLTIQIFVLRVFNP